ncbi:hypothetical protein [Micropruina sp.]|uniref:hypothetical protein n=1 Tax=Micropruina sp. TaxID=2737536 RepID=UPI0039E337C5
MTDPTDAARPLAAAARRPRFPRWSRHLGAVVLAGALSVGLVSAAPPAQAASPAFCSDGSQPYVPVSEARGWAAGRTVSGKTVVRGTDPEAFTGSYIGFIEGYFGKGKDLLLFKLSSPTIDGTNGLKAAGIWAGMSGSPVYDGNGRLIGAVSYALSPDNLPVAGVTPAEYMKTIGTTVVSQPKSARVSAASLKVTAAGTRVAGKSLAGGQLTQVKTVNIAGPAGTAQNAFTNRTLARTPRTAGAASLLRSGTFAAAPQQSATAKPLVVGGNITATMVSGDMVIGSIGTVTAICGKTVWAFGHPLNLEGKTSMLISNASVAMVVPDGTGVQGSYKETSQLFAPVGVLTQDRTAGIRGTIGALTGFPLTVKVQNPKGVQVDKYVATVAYPDAAAAATAGLVGTAAMEQLDQYSSGTGKVSWTISYKRANGKTGTLSNSQVVDDRYYFPDEIGTPPADDVWAISQQVHEKVTVTGVTVTLKLLSSDAVNYRVSKVQRLSGKTWVNLSGSKLKAGTKYSLRPVYQVVRNDRVDGTTAGAKFRVTLPASARTKGSVQLIGATSFDPCQADENGETECDEWDDEFSDPTNSFDELIALLRTEQSDATLIGKLSYKVKKGSRSRTFTLTGPGSLSGSTTAGFTIKK